jgi:hypothetical protein
MEASGLGFRSNRSGFSVQRFSTSRINERKVTMNGELPTSERFPMSIKVMTIVGTRPEIIKLSRVIDELDQHTQHILAYRAKL